jgi:hypothetical protein
VRGAISDRKTFQVALYIRIAVAQIFPIEIDLEAPVPESVRGNYIRAVQGELEMPCAVLIFVALTHVPDHEISPVHRERRGDT